MSGLVQRNTFTLSEKLPFSKYYNKFIEISKEESLACFVLSYYSITALICQINNLT